MQKLRCSSRELFQNLWGGYTHTPERIFQTILLIALTSKSEWERRLDPSYILIQIVVCGVTNRLSKAGQFIIETAAKGRPIERDKIPEDASPLVKL